MRLVRCFENRLSLVLFLSLPQLYIINVSKSYLPLALFSILILLPELLIRSKLLLTNRLVQLVLILSAIQAFSLSWSPEKNLGVKEIVYNLYFLAIFCSCLTIDKNIFEKKILVKTSVFLSLSVSIIIVVFRFQPDLGNNFLTSSWSNLFISPNVADGIRNGSIRVNTLDPEKSGFVFVNANVAGCYLGMLALALWGWKKGKTKYLYMLIALAGAYSTGSKTVVIIAMFLSLVFVIFSIATRNFIELKRQVVFFAINIIFVVIGFTSFMPAVSDFFQQEKSTPVMEEKRTPVMEEKRTPVMEEKRTPIMEEKRTYSALESRLLIWRYGEEAFLQKPVMGQGFGGWQKHFPDYVDSLELNGVDVQKNFPPHNTFIYLWSQSGFFAAFIGGAIIFYWLFLSCLSYHKHKNSRQKTHTIIAMSGVWIWLTVHGMGDNTGLLGEAHQTALLAVCIGMLYRYSKFNRVVSHG